jgi:hypothetical protein
MRDNLRWHQQQTLCSKHTANVFARGQAHQAHGWLMKGATLL